MKKQLLSAIFCALLAVPAFADKGPEIDLVDNKLSIDAETVPLSRLLRLLDLATGMKSKVPPELANRNISVKFSGLNVADGVRKMFEGQPFDYVVIEGQGITVTAASQNISGTETVPVYNPGPTQPDQPFAQEFQQQLPQAGQGQPPRTLQTPFGPMAVQQPNQPNQANQPNQPNQGNQPNGAISAPGQSNGFFSNPTQQQNPAQTIPNGQQPVNPTPFGTTAPVGSPTPFGTPPQSNPQSNPQNNNSNNSLFGGQPPVFNPGNH